MEYNKGKMALDGWVTLKKGYVPAQPGKEQAGHEPTSGVLGSPPTTGSVVAKPASPKKDNS